MHIQPTRRKSLPPRCPSTNIEFRTDYGHKVHLTIQYDPSDLSAPCGLFYASGFHCGSDLEFMMQDACILISLLLQHGLSVETLKEKISQTEKSAGQRKQSSMINTVITELAKYHRASIYE